MINVGIIGYGNMGQAIGERIKDNYAVCVFDKIKSIISENITVLNNSTELVKRSQIIILAVKPQDLDSLLNEIKSCTKERLIISIAAGVTTEFIRSQLPETTRLIRVMPNLPAQVGQGASVLFKDKFATEGDLDLTQKLLSYVGRVLVVNEEKIINAATAISGSGPAFFCQYITDKVNASKKRNEFIEILVTSAVKINLNQQFARILSEATVDGTMAMLKEKNLTCAELIKMVASKGGTTEAGLVVLQNGGSIAQAVKAAWLRAEELGQKT